MGFKPAKDIPTPQGHYQTREQTALFKVMGRFLHEDNNTIIRRFWWICPDGNCTSEQLDQEIQRLRRLGRATERDIQKFQGVKTPVLPPVKRKKPLSKKGLLR